MLALNVNAQTAIMDNLYDFPRRTSASQHGCDCLERTSMVFVVFAQTKLRGQPARYCTYMLQVSTIEEKASDMSCIPGE